MRPKYLNNINNKSKSTSELEDLKMLRNGFTLSVLQGVLIGIIFAINDLDFLSTKGLTVFFLILICGFLGQFKNQS